MANQKTVHLVEIRAFKSQADEKAGRDLPTDTLLSDIDGYGLVAVRFAYSQQDYDDQLKEIKQICRARKIQRHVNFSMETEDGECEYTTQRGTAKSALPKYRG